MEKQIGRHALLACVFSRTLIAQDEHFFPSTEFDLDGAQLQEFNC